MKKIRINPIMIIITIISLVFITSQIIYTQSNDDITTSNDQEEKTTDELIQEELNILVNRYNEVVKENKGWNAEFEVIKEIKKHIDNNYHNPLAYEALVKFYYKYGSKIKASEYGQKAIDVSNKLKEIYFTRDVIYYMGLYYINHSRIDYGKALGYFNLVNAMGNDETSAKAELMYNIGLCYYKMFQVREIEDDMRFSYLAEVAYEFSVFLEPNIESLYDLGNIYIIFGKYENALDAFNQALDINPSIEKVLDAKEDLLEIMP